ncbi:MAG: pilus assembly protein N-terminal domain-containing protein [Myxococcaceae bacterium]|nr:pilus assembly protein N-terminal domain-containing protein [Myxococcaceae bacterium]
MLASLLITLLQAAPDAGVATLTWDERSAVKLVEGQVARLVLTKPPSRLAASDPAVCEVQSDKGGALLLTARKPGTVTVALWYGVAFRGLQVEVAARQAARAPALDAGASLFTWDGEHGFEVPRAVDFVVQGPGGLEKVSPGSHRRCVMTSIGNDQLRFRCDEAGPVTVFLWYANSRRRVLELDVSR